MDIFEATMIAEGVHEPKDKAEYIAAWQHLIDTRACWTMQGYFGRMATQLIEEGVCKPAESDRKAMEKSNG